MAITDLVTDPMTFFREDGRRNRLVGPLALMAALVTVSLVTSGMFIVWLTAKLPSDVSSNLLLIRVLSAGISGLFVPVVLWVGYAAAFHAISAFYGGTGSFRTTLKYVGWGFLPKVVGSLVVLAGMYLAVSSTAAPESAEAVARASRAVTNDPYLTMSRLVSPVFTVWCGVIWLFGVAEARDIDVRGAAVSVGVPVALSIALTVATTV